MIHKKRWKWSNLLPWNWLRCCKGSAEDSRPVPAGNDHKLTKDEAISMLNNIDAVDVKIAISEPVSSIYKKLSIHKSRRKPWDSQQFNIYLLRDNQLELKGQKSLVSCSTFGTYKDFVSWSFGQLNQCQYDIFVGSATTWHKVALTGKFTNNRLYRFVHKETQETYVILTNHPFYNNMGKLETPSKRLNQMADHLVDRSDLSKPPSKGFNPVPANYFGQP